jgi:glycosyltransferase involved in cell wall biosynthesis
MPMPLKVSVITPSYNQGRFIERTIQSVLSQQFAGSLEYLVMDGGSRDETVPILRRYGDCIQWVSEKDNGQGDAVNKGIQRSQGEIIGWMNSDDIYYPGAINAACDFFAAHPEIDVIYGNANHIDEHDQVLEPYPTEDWDFERFKERCYICQPAIFLRRSVVQRVGPLDPRLYFCMDYEYWIRLALAGARFSRVDHLVAGSRMYATNKTLGGHVKSHVEINNMLRAHFTRVPDRWLFNYAHLVLDDRGIPRDDRLQFTMFVSALSLSAAVRWNRRISRSMLHTVCKWVGHAVREELRAS